LAATTGARRGELCALRWTDIDFEKATLRFDESVVAASGGAVVRGPKTRASIRTIAIDLESLAELEALRSDHEQLALDCGTTLAPEAFVFTAVPPGLDLVHPDTVSHAFSRVRRAAGLPEDVHLHSLRHFHATLLDPVISERQKQARLGWATVHMAPHYTGRVATEDRLAAEHVGGVLSMRPQEEQTRELA
jgi:integrase